jgi:4-amino-4-deoxy-L-arabinose transferase-like glycosyltransferase
MRRKLLALFLVAFVLRVAAVLVIGEYERPNTWESGMVADALLRGHGFALDWRTMLGTPPDPDAASTWWPPAYPLFLAACRIAAPGASWLLASVLQAAMLAAIPVLLYSMGKRLFGETAGCAAAGLAAIHPPLLGYASLIQTAAFEIFWLTLALFFATRVDRDTCLEGVSEQGERGARLEGKRDAYLAGLSLAVAALTRGPVLALLVVAPAAWLANGVRPRRALALSAFLFLGALTLLGPWAARNYHVRGAFVLVSSKGGWNLFMGNNPYPAPWDQKQAIQPDFRAKLMEMNEVESDRYLRSLALKYMREHPRETIRNMGRRARDLVWFNEDFGKRSGFSSTLRRITRPVYMVAWPFLLLFAAYGVVRTRRAWRRLISFYGMIAAISAVILLTFFQNRFRAPLEPVLLLFAGAALADLLGLYRARRENRGAGTPRLGLPDSGSSLRTP